MYSHGTQADVGPVETKIELPRGKAPFDVIFGPAVWGEEPASYAGHLHWVRWLQNETAFVVQNWTDKPQDVVISADIATFAQPRHVNLAANGRSVGEGFEITQNSGVVARKPSVLPQISSSGQITSCSKLMDRPGSCRETAQRICCWLVASGSNSGSSERLVPRHSPRTREAGSPVRQNAVTRSAPWRPVAPDPHIRACSKAGERIPGWDADPAFAVRIQ
jgi:hypothetical protein